MDRPQKSAAHLRHQITIVAIVLCLGFAPALFSGCGNNASPTSAGHSASPGGSAPDTGAVELLNVSYDPTRELWRDLNEQFIADYKQKTVRNVTIKQSHGGSSSQARAV